MNRVKEYRLMARLTTAQLARRAGVDGRTASRAEEGQAIREVQAVAIADALSQALNTTLTAEDLGINIYNS